MHHVPNTADLPNTVFTVGFANSVPHRKISVPSSSALTRLTRSLASDFVAGLIRRALADTVQTAQSSVIIAPQNFFAADTSHQTIHQVRLDFTDAKVTNVTTFGTNQPTCMLDMNSVAPDLTTFIGEVIIPKFPFDQLDSVETNPGG